MFLESTAGTVLWSNPTGSSHHRRLEYFVFYWQKLYIFCFEAPSLLGGKTAEMILAWTFSSTSWWAEGVWRDGDVANRGATIFL